jgi:glycosyltransferase involved in cell wall biosynthesis
MTIMAAKRFVLVLAYHFPPLMGGETLRVHAFVKYLTRYGYVPQIITVETAWYGNAGFDASLLAQYPTDVKISRSRSLMPAGTIASNIRADVMGLRKQALPFSSLIKKLLRFIYRIFVFPDETILWLPYALKAGLQYVRQNKPDIIFATTPPHGVGLIAALISRITRLPLVLDVRDDWVGNPLFSSNRGLRFKLAQRLERWIVQQASAVVAVTPESRALIRQKFPERDPKFCVVIANGFDPQNFEALSLLAKPVRPPAPLKIIYAGGLPLKRSPLAFLNALKQFVEKYADEAALIEVVIMGNVRREYQQAIANLHLDDFVRYVGFQPQSETVRMMQTANVGLLIIPAEEGSATAIPGKLYEYMAANLFVLALADINSAVGTVIKNLKLGITVQNTSDDILEALLQLSRLFQNGELNRPLPMDVLAQFNREKQTLTLSQLFDSIISESKSL